MSSLKCDASTKCIEFLKGREVISQTKAKSRAVLVPDFPNLVLPWAAGAPEGGWGGAGAGFHGGDWAEGGPQG